MAVKPRSVSKTRKRAATRSGDHVPRPGPRAFMTGRQVEPLQLRGNENVADLIDNCYANSGFNGRRLAEACHLYSRMIDAGATIGLTLSGAMTPIGMQGPLSDLIRAGFIDWMISTGANLYHDLHRTFNFPVTQGHWNVDDNALADAGVARIYDTYIAEDGTLMATDKIILAAVRGIDRTKPLSTAEFHWQLGRAVKKLAPQPGKSLVVAAHECDVPVYTSSPGDSSIAMNLIVPLLGGDPLRLDPVLDVLETAAIVRSGKENGVVEVGGGSPKNFYLQTQPTLHQILFDRKGGGHDYFIQLTTDSPQWGGLSGATPGEARSWGKIKDANVNNVVVYSCASLTLPLLASYVLIRNKPRKLKRVYRTIGESVEALRAQALKAPQIRRELAKLGLLPS